MAAIGQTISNYKIVEKIGAGGMGEVYLARDTRLGRDVAIKVLPEAFAHDPGRLSRFEREARMLAALNHPQIAQIFGFEDSKGTCFLAMELVPGETLAERIQRGPIPIDEALDIAKSICEALEAAHEKGVIHRDLKPANVKVTPEGKVKVLDFGLAKAFAGDATNEDIRNSPTMSQAATMQGVILGTAAYMSPEQARGKAVDKRADIWAFGCVLYELLTGKQVFAGENITDILAALVKSEPDWAALPADTPPEICKLLRRCLAKDRQQRLQDIGDARIEIDTALASPAEPATSSHAGSARRRGARWVRAIPWAVAALSITAALLAIQAAARRGAPPAGPVTRLEMVLPSGIELYGNVAQSEALSPDGTRVAFVGVLGGVRQIYERRFDEFEAIALRGTENANSVFFSQDGRSLGFISTDGLLKRVSLADGLVVTVIRDADYLAGGVWGEDDRITFVRSGALWQIPASGGIARQLTTLDAAKRELSHAWPTAVAGGKSILFASITGSGRDAAHIEALSLATGRRRVVIDPGTFPLYAPSGHLVFFRNGALLAAPFDLDRLEVTGSTVRMIEDLPEDSGGAPLVAVSGAGALAYLSSRAWGSKLVWVSRQGVEQPIADTPRRYSTPRLAPDGQRILVSTSNDLWIQDVARATFTRLTSDATVGNNFPIWTPDGKRVVFRTRMGLRWIEADGSGRSGVIPNTSPLDFPTSISPKGDTLAFVRYTGDTSSDVEVLSLQGEPQPRAVVATPAAEGGGQFSPDGRWLAYTSNDSGQVQVYVIPFPGPGRRWQVSTQGGRSPLWSRDGKELFYRNGNKMMVVGVSIGADLAFSPPRLLFEQQYAFGMTTTLPNYDISLDGQRFLMVKDESSSGRLNVVLNWFEELKRKVPTGK